MFSFHATKTMAIGEGGVVVTADEGLAEATRRLVNFGLDRPKPIARELGLNAKMSEIQAAVGLAALDGLGEVIADRRATAAAVRTAATGLGLRFQRGSERSTWPAINVQAPSGDVRDRVLELGPMRGVEFRSYFDVPMHRTPMFHDCPRVGDLAVTEELSARALTLPISTGPTDTAIEPVLECIRDAEGVSGPGHP